MGERAEAPEPGAAGAGLCTPDFEHLCIQGGRFRVSARFATLVGLAGDGIAAPLSDESGTFWFFWPENLELYVKVLDGCPVNEHFWLYAAGLTDVQVELEVEDTLSGVSETYDNPMGTPFPPVHEVSLLTGCP